MIHAYDKIYLSRAQANLGRMLDFAVYEMRLDLREYYDLFLVSRISKSFAKGNPTFVVGMSGIELCYAVLDSVGVRYQITEPHSAEERSREYWSGWALAYYQWYSGLGFSDIDRNVPIESIRNMYSPYHEMDIRQFSDKMEKIVHEKRVTTNLARIRRREGISQKVLADRSGVPVRTIQQYEQRNKDINKAMSQTLYSFSKVLGCGMDELIEK